MARQKPWPWSSCSSQPCTHSYSRAILLVSATKLRRHCAQHPRARPAYWSPAWARPRRLCGDSRPAPRASTCDKNPHYSSRQTPWFQHESFVQSSLFIPDYSRHTHTVAPSTFLSVSLHVLTYRECRDNYSTPHSTYQLSSTVSKWTSAYTYMHTLVSRFPRIMTWRGIPHGVRSWYMTCHTHIAHDIYDTLLW